MYRSNCFTWGLSCQRWGHSIFEPRPERLCRGCTQLGWRWEGRGNQAGQSIHRVGIRRRSTHSETMTLLADSLRSGTRFAGVNCFADGRRNEDSVEHLKEVTRGRVIINYTSFCCCQRVSSTHWCIGWRVWKAQRCAAGRRPSSKRLGNRERMWARRGRAGIQAWPRARRQS
jgi:hypothetical protein